MKPEKAAIRAVLEQDRAWALYALGDLADDLYPQTEWHLRGGSLMLIYRGLHPPILFLQGDTEDFPFLMEDLSEPIVSLSIPPDALPPMKRRYRILSCCPMHRMVLDSAVSLPALEGLRRLTGSDRDALAALFADGHSRGEAPDAFQREMLEHGVFYGVWQRGDLLAAAGTHLVSVEFGVAAVGNVYTLHGARGRGLGTAATAAVSAALQAMGIRTIGLNVRADNAAAIRAYAKIGYRWERSFFEGQAERVEEGRIAPPVE